MRDLYHRVIRQVAYPAAVLMAILVGIPILRAFLADVAGVAEAPFDVQLYRILRDVGLRMGGTLAVLIVLSRLLFRFTTRESVLIYCWPFAGIIRTLILSRFAWAMAEFTRAGLPLDQAVRHAGAATGARRMAHDFATLAPRLREGYTLTEALAASRYLSPTAQTYIRTGEVAGELDTAFEHLYRALYDTALFRLRVLIILIGPLAILGLGALTVAAHL
jgi:type II secretory pathway component PulF